MAPPDPDSDIQDFPIDILELLMKYVSAFYLSFSSRKSGELSSAQLVPPSLGSGMNAPMPMTDDDVFDFDLVSISDLDRRRRELDRASYVVKASQLTTSLPH